jgi:hypothetical protein
MLKRECQNLEGREPVSTEQEDSVEDYRLSAIGALKEESQYLEIKEFFRYVVEIGYSIFHE